MSTVTDLVSQQTITYDTDGYKAERIFLVDDVTGSTYERLYNAINDVGIPDYGDAHPAISSINVTEITGKPMSSGTQFQVSVLYQKPENVGGVVGGDAIVSVSGTTSIIETDRDINGERMFATLDGSVYGTGVMYQSRFWTAEVDQPRISMHFEYTAASFPQAEIATYLGKVNSLPWNGYTEKAVLCTSINADEQGDTYKVKFTFAVEDATWQFVGAVKHNDLKMPVSHHPTNPDYNFDIYQAAKRFDVYEFVDFTPLGFDLNVVFANLSGTAMDFPTLSETEIKAGGDTIIITLYNDTWVAAGATFDAVRQDILDGLVSNKSEANGWNAELAIPRTLSVSSVVRTSSTVVTITTTANALYEITESEIISCTIPASALVTTSSDMIPANKAFTIGGG